MAQSKYSTDDESSSRQSPVDGDVGKRVETHDGSILGMATAVTEDHVLIEPVKGLLAGYGSWQSCPWDHCSTFQLENDSIVRITDNAIIVEPASME